MSYDPLISAPLDALTPEERKVLDALEVALTEAHALHAPWRVRAAFIAGAATVLEALGSET